MSDSDMSVMRGPRVERDSTEPVEILTGEPPVPRLAHRTL